MSKRVTRADLALELRLLRERWDQREQALKNVCADNDVLRKKLTERVDVAMMAERVKLASNLGQMMEAVSKAVGFIIGKEVL